MPIESMSDHVWLTAALRARLAAQMSQPVETIETHISTVLLAGEFAYKLKKPVSLGFLDFSTLAQRRFFCEEELRLNRRTAPQIYLDVVPIAGSIDVPSIGAGEPVLDYAVRMRRFDTAAVLDQVARDGRLTADAIDRLAQAIARFHAAAVRVGPESGFGTTATVSHWQLDNVDSLRAHAHSPEARERLDRLADWTRGQLERHAPRLAARHADGFIRECHGDLHLGNIVLLGVGAGEPTPFDAIEFNPELRWIDVVSDVAFTTMDLHDHRLSGLAWRLASGYFEHTGDYEGLALLQLYSVYRALVRAKVAQIREHQPQLARAARVHEFRSFADHLALAERLAEPGAPLLVAMSGLSGSGKSIVAQSIAEHIGGIRVRSDVERKRLFGLPPTAASGGSIYTAEATRRTYARLHAVARIAAAAGVPVVIDAASLRQAERDALRTLAAELGARFVLVVCEAPLDVLRARVGARAAAGADASEADLPVLERQIGWREPLAPGELAKSTVVDTAIDRGALEARCREIAATLQQG